MNANLLNRKSVKNNDPERIDKKITLLTFSLDHGGAEKVCLTLSNEFARRNYETELWIINYRESSLTVELDNKIKIFKLHRKHVRNSLFPLIKLLFRRKPEKILIFHIELAVLIIVLKKLLFLKTTVIVRSINTLSRAYDYPSGIWEKYLARPVIKWILPKSDKIITQSTGMYRDMIKNFKIPPQNMVTIHNPAFNLRVNGTVKMDEKEKSITIGLAGGVTAVLVDAIFGFPLQLAASISLFWMFMGLTVFQINIYKAKDGKTVSKGKGNHFRSKKVSGNIPISNRSNKLSTSTFKKALLYFLVIIFMVTCILFLVRPFMAKG